LFEVDTSITMSELNGVERVIVHRLEAEENSLRRAMRTFWNCILLLMQSDRGPIPKDVLGRTIGAMGSRQYKAFIGVEKGGLIWAGAIARRRPTALIYSNLELYTRNHPFVFGWWRRMKAVGRWRRMKDVGWWRLMKAAEEMNHSRCWA